MRIEFSGTAVIVTGAAVGFGRAIAHGFAARGARVFGCDIDTDGLAVTLADAPTGDGAAKLTVHDVDVTDRTQVGRLVDLGIAECGEIGVLVNDAGGVCGQVGRPLEEVSATDWQIIYDVNVTGAFNFIQAVAPHMKRAGAGAIINISSGAGLGISLTGIQAYASAKAAQIGLTRQLAHELGPFGIRVNNVAPGFVRSNAASEKQWQSYGADGQEALLQRIALRRLGRPDDIADAVLFLASDQAGWITGQVLSVDGGK